jgi:hypothetical protein
MRRKQRILLLAVIGLVLPVLAGCSDFDPDKLDVFGLNDKKKLPGDRKPLFPEGVPGVSQGIPPEFIKGNLPAPDTAALPAAPDNSAAAAPAKKTAAVEPGAEPKAKPKPKRKPKANATAAAPAGQSQPAASDQQQQPAAWPTQQGQGQSSTGTANAPWPSGSPSGN